MSIVSSLSKLLTKMGGQPSAGDNSDELIEKIADKYTPSSALPVVDVYDNGKFLKVDDGEWSAVNNTFIVTCTPDAPDMSGTMDATPENIYSAYQAGKEIIIRLIMGEYQYYEIHPFVSVDNERAAALLVGVAVDGAEETGYFLIQLITSSRESTYSTLLLPLPTTLSDNAPLVLHGTLTSAMGGTITEVPQDLMDAITANKRIIFAITMPTIDGTADYIVECTVTKVEDSKPYAYGTCSTEGSELLAIYIGEVNDNLVFEAGQYTLTPYTP